MRNLFFFALTLLVIALFAWLLPDLRWAIVLVPCGLLMVGLILYECGKSDFPRGAP